MMAAYEKVLFKELHGASDLDQLDIKSLDGVKGSELLFNNHLDSMKELLQSLHLSKTKWKVAAGPRVIGITSTPRINVVQ